jgi:ribosome-associated translation inhibitor RaiA
MTDQIQSPPISNIDPHARWKFIRDVGVFQLKLFLNNMHNFVQIPLTLAVAAYDLLFPKGQTGERFYQILELGRAIDDSIDIYSVIGHREASLNEAFTVDVVLSKLESVIVREYEKGGTAATVKTAVDRAIDEMQNRAGASKEKFASTIQQATEKVKQKMEKGSA